MSNKVAVLGSVTFQTVPLAGFGNLRGNRRFHPTKQRRKSQPLHLTGFMRCNFDEKWGSKQSVERPPRGPIRYMNSVSHICFTG